MLNEQNEKVAEIEEAATSIASDDLIASALKAKIDDKLSEKFSLK